MYIATVGMLQLHSKGRSCLAGQPISHPPKKLHQYNVLHTETKVLLLAQIGMEQ